MCVEWIWRDSYQAIYPPRTQLPRGETIVFGAVRNGPTVTLHPRAEGGRQRGS